MRRDIIIRPATPADLTAINAIFNYYVAHSTCVWTTTPCSAAERKAWYEEHGEAMPILVAERGGRVVGWGSLSSFRTAYTLAGTLEDSIYVRHDFLRQGIGSRLLTELIGAARRKGLRSILANISADQKPSLRLHGKFGFQKVAHLRQVGQKFNRRFDAVYLQLPLAANNSVERMAAGSTRSRLRLPRVRRHRALPRSAVG
jgi:L-amino acid N-acyltransferase